MHADTLLDIAMMHSDSLILRAQTGDRSAQGRLVQLWYKRIYNFCFKFFLDHDVAMESSQKTFIAMCRYIRDLQDTTRFKPWLYKIAYNNCREEARRHKASRSMSFDLLWNPEEENSPEWESNSVGDDPESQYRQAEVSAILQKALGKIPPEQRAVIIMKEYEGLKFREIAEALGLSENTVKSRLYYGLEALKKVLEKQNFNKNTLGYEL